jgi:hypothetical protein
MKLTLLRAATIAALLGMSASAHAMPLLYWILFG